MIRFVLRKMLNTKWMVFCLLIGIVLAVGMVSSIPLFTNGILNRMLRLDLEEYQQNTGVYTGRLSFKSQIEAAYKPESRTLALEYFDQEIPRLAADIGLPIDVYNRVYLLTGFRAAVSGAEFNYNERDDLYDLEQIQVASLKGFDDHVTYLFGKAPSDKITDGLIEIAVSNKMMRDSIFTLGGEYELYDIMERDPAKKPFKVKVVGIYEQAESGDMYFFDGHGTNKGYLIVNEDAFNEAFVHGDICYVNTAEYFMALDYHSARISNIDEVYDKLVYFQNWVSSRGAGTTRAPMIRIIEGYGESEAQLRTMLLVIQMPIMLMLAFYAYMISQLILEYEKNEIAVLRSRGSSRRQIVLIYLYESIIIGAVSFVLGIALGYFMCRMLGTCNGFLEFVSRTALTLEFTENVFIYAGVTVLFSILTMLIPAIGYSKTTIVEHKTSKTKKKTPLWKKMCLDLVLIFIAGYGYYGYTQQMYTMTVTGMDSNSLPIDPLLFVISTFFIVGFGLLMLRIFPYLIRFIYFIGKKFWSPVLYASFLQVGRSGGKETFIMLFLIMTLSVGLFSANTARTLNTNTEERIQYTAGADMILTPAWESNAIIMTDEATGEQTTILQETEKGYANDRLVTYIEPSFVPYETMEGVESAAKVFVKTGVNSYYGTKTSSCDLMAIDPEAFGKTAFMPDELLPVHWYNYLNLLSYEQRACLISRAYAEELGIKEGDLLNVSWSRQSAIDMRVYGIFDYWPSYQYKEGTKAASNRMIVCNLSYTQANMVIEPYQVWLKKAPDATSAQIYQAIEDQNLRLSELHDSSQEIVAVKNDPLLQGVNGALTMGFIVTMIVCAIGFLIYWILSIKGRVLQFGILRAMGLAGPKMIGMLLMEQLLISGVAIILGISTGALASTLFVPLLQMVCTTDQLVLPFRVMFERGDYIKLYAILGMMLTVAFVVLGGLISRIKMAQALKLGED